MRYLVSTVLLLSILAVPARIKASTVSVFCNAGQPAGYTTLVCTYAYGPGGVASAVWAQFNSHAEYPLGIPVSSTIEYPFYIGGSGTRSHWGTCWSPGGLWWIFGVSRTYFMGCSPLQGCQYYVTNDTSRSQASTILPERPCS
jgi:hypothetical protein